MPLWLAGLFLPSLGHCAGLAAAEVLVLYHATAAESAALAREYAAGRGIPAGNLLALSAPAGETVRREDFNLLLLGPLRKELGKRTGIKALVVMYGLPLKVMPRALSLREEVRLKSLERQRDGLKPAAGEARAALEREIRGLDRSSEIASVDSELTLARLEDLPLPGWIDNPLARRHSRRLLPWRTEEVLMVSRLDGSEAGQVRRMMADSLAVERGGLAGTALIDARWPRSKGEEDRLTAYALYDLSLHRTVTLLRGLNWPVIVDQQEALFPEGLELPTALYCGWYSLGRYIDTFVWQPGAVGYHIASSECETLKRQGSQVWCKRMIEQGITATLGPVAEPYVQGFPLPEEFFGLLSEGQTLVESYFQALPHLSWRMVLIGDPLYRPFGQQGRAGP